uniref:Uncharacterized protein n=1 Tax=Panagrolaimus sp. ES5 TaxID=591445 RepID=A0AC34G7I8_9BILA
MQQLESLTQTLRGPSYEISEQHHQHQNSHQQQQQHHEQQQQMLPQSSNNNSNSTLLPPASLLSSSKRKVENISGQLQYPQQQQQQQVQQRFPRPNTLPLGGLNVKEDSLISPGSSSFGDDVPEQHHQHQNSHQQQHHEQQQQQMLPQSSNNNSNSTLLPPASLLSSSKRKVENISGQLQYPQQQQQQQVQQRFPRPNTLPLGGLNVKEDSLISPGSSSFGDDAMLFDSPGAKRNKFADDSPPERPTTLSLIHSWGQTPAIVTPSNGMPQISEFFKTNFPEEYNMLNQQTFLTPIAPNAISVSSATLLPPPRSDDLQDL